MCQRAASSVCIAYNDIGAAGASTLAAILKETRIQELKCAAAPERSLLCQCADTKANTLGAAH